jgi:Uma2 family endonuclease
MTTALKLGPADHGRPLAFADFMAGDYQEGYQYELIDGKLYVSPQANAPQGRIERWIYKKLDRYSDEHRDIINYVHPKARVFVPDRPGVTVAEPDVTAYHAFPLDQPLEEDDWAHFNPTLVVEVLSISDPAKDLVRNVELYLQVPTIREYWVLDTRESVSRLVMHVFRRRGRSWQRPLFVRYGETYTTRLLPGFELVLDPRR